MKLINSMVKDNKTLYFAQAGELFVASELLFRGWNVAFPRVDRGVDAIIVNDEQDTDSFPLQVKTGTAKQMQKLYKVQYSTPLNQIISPNTKFNLRYAFVVRQENKWAFVLVIDLEKMKELHSEGYLGNPNKEGKLIFSIQYQYNENLEIDVFLKNKQQSLNLYLNAYPLPTHSIL